MTANFSREQEAAVVAAVQQGRDDIMMWIANGSVSPTVTAFAQLHDHLDANTAGDLCRAGGAVRQRLPSKRRRGKRIISACSQSRTGSVRQLAREQHRANPVASGGNYRRGAGRRCREGPADPESRRWRCRSRVFFMGGQGEAVRDYFRRYVNGEIAALLKDRAIAAPDN